MATKVILPKLGQTMEEGTIVEWLKAEGDSVNRGDILFQVESDKAVLEVESRAKGVLRKILVDKGVKVPVLTPVAIIAQADEDIGELLAEVEAGAPAEGATAPQPAAPAPAAAPSAAAAPAPPPAPTPIARPEGRIFASPRARKLAREKGVDLAYVAGSGPNGRIIEKDVLAFLEAQPAATPLARQVAAEMGIPLSAVPAAGGRVTAEAVRAMAAAPAAAPLPPAEGELTPLSGLRAIIAERMATSAHTTAAVTLESEVDATALVALREKLKAALQEELGFSVSYNDILGIILARCLKEYPYMNVRLEEGGIRQLTEINIGVAVDSPRGLLVPVVRGVDRMGLKELAKTARDLVTRAREGKALPDELSGGSITLTNLGMFGVDAFSPIINLPECSILGVGRIKPEPAVVDGEIVVRQKMWLSLTFDHRLVDGAPAARFLQAIMRYIEDPELLLT